MFRRAAPWILRPAAVAFLSAAAGCAHQREAFFPPSQPGSAFAPSARSSGSRLSQKPQPAAAAKKSARTDQSAALPRDDEEPAFDFNEVAG